MARSPARHRNSAEVAAQADLLVQPALSLPGAAAVHRLAAALALVESVAAVVARAAVEAAVEAEAEVLHKLVQAVAARKVRPVRVQNVPSSLLFVALESVQTELAAEARCGRLN